MPYLEVKTKLGKKRLKLPTDSLTIGRLPDNNLVVIDDKASRHHCVIEPWDEGYRIRDLGSRNGTKLNKHRITAELLDNGDVVMIGATELRFIDPEQQNIHKRPNTPDFSSAYEDADQSHDQTTLDLLNIIIKFIGFQ